MKSIKDSNIFYNLQVYFKNNFLDQLPNDDKVWSAAFSRWLAEQGCKIEHHHARLIRNSLGIAPHYDSLVFEDERLYTMFLLRWA